LLGSSPYELKRPLSRLATNDAAELYAVYSALSFVNSFKMRNSKIMSVVLLSDSQFAVTSSQTGLPGIDDTYHHLISRIKNLKNSLRNNSVQVKIQWIPGHTEHIGNDAADRLAKAACLTSKSMPISVPNPQIPYSVHRSFVTKRINHKYQLWWNSTTHGRSLFEVRKDITQSPPNSFASIQSCRVRKCISRLRIGNAMNNSILFKAKVVNSPSCSHCPDINDSALHRIFDCPFYMNHRNIFKNTLQTKCNVTLFDRSTILNHSFIQKSLAKLATDALVKFLIDTDLQNLFIWKPLFIMNNAESSDSEVSS
jgi:ribonuclease HI